MICADLWLKDRRTCSWNRRKPESLIEGPPLDTGERETWFVNKTREQESLKDQENLGEIWNSRSLKRSSASSQRVKKKKHKKNRNAPGWDQQEAQIVRSTKFDHPLTAHNAPPELKHTPHLLFHELANQLAQKAQHFLAPYCGMSFLAISALFLLYIHFGKSLWFTWIPCNEASACRVSIIKQTNNKQTKNENSAVFEVSALWRCWPTCAQLLTSKKGWSGQETSKTWHCCAAS